MVPYVERELKKIPISIRERVSKTEMYIVLYVDMSTEEAIDVIGGIVIKSEHDLHRLRSSVLREGRSVLHLMPEEEVSSALLNLTTTVVPVIYSMSFFISSVQHKYFFFYKVFSKIISNPSNF